MKDIEIVYLEVDEEILSIISRLGEIGGEKAIFVVPKEAILTHSLINLKLLAKEAKKRGKTLDIVTTDEAGVNLAKKAGFAVYDSLGQAKAIQEEYNDTREDEEFQEEDSFSDQEGVEDETEEKSSTDDEADQDVPTAKDQLSHSPAPEEANQEPMARRDFDMDKNEMDKQTPTFKGKVPFGLKFKFNKRFLKIGLIVLGVVVVGAGLTLAYLYLPKAQISLYLKAQEKDAQTTLAMAQDAKNGELKSQTIEIDKDKTGQGKATGQKEQGAKATGKIIISNYWDSAPQLLVAGTRFQAISNNKIFRVPQEITVPGTTIQQGNLVPGSIEIEVEADDIGAEYNIAPDRFIIPGLPTDKQAKIYGESNNPMTGGIKKTVKVVSQDDCTNLLNSTKEALQKETEKDLAQKAKAYKDYKFDTGFIFSQVAEEKCDPAVDSEANSFSASAKVHYIVFLYKENDLKALLKDKMQPEISKTKDLATDSFSQIDFLEKNVDIAKKYLNLKIKTNLILIAKLDISAIKNNILGKDRDSATKYLNSFSDVKKVEIKFLPSFIKRLPKSANRIMIETKEAK